jgi:hypothetical protein
VKNFVLYHNKENLFLLPFSTSHFELWAAVLKEIFFQQHYTAMQPGISTEDRYEIDVPAAD